MQIIRTEEYQKELLGILKYIAKDKISASRIFKKNLNIQINNISIFPYFHINTEHHSILMMIILEI